MSEFQWIWGVSSPTHIPLATQDIPLFLKHIIWISGLKWSINSRSHTVFFQKATRLETVRAGLYMQQWWKLYIELVNHVGHMLMLFVMLHSGQFWIKKLQY